jgi:flavodoxin
MNSIVIYGSLTDNGQAVQVAEAIADVLAQRGDVRLVAAEDAAAVELHDDEFLVVGGSTEGHTMPPAVRDFFDLIALEGLWGGTAAVFDTRLGMPRWWPGSAAAAITDRLIRLGAHVIEPEGRFIVAGSPPFLVSGELGRARAWAAALADAAAPVVASKARTGTALVAPR